MWNFSTCFHIDLLLHSTKAVGGKIALSTRISEHMGTETLSVTIIDDDETVHYIIKTMIRRQNPSASVNCYSSASAFLSAYDENFTSNGILLDINMPKMDGWQLLDKLKQLDFKIPIYMFSSSSNLQDVDRIHRYEIVKGYIVKPLTTEKLTTLLSVMFEKEAQVIKR